MSTTRRSFLISATSAIATGTILPDSAIDKHITYSIPAEIPTIWVPMAVIATAPMNTKFESIGFDPYTQWVKVVDHGQFGFLIRQFTRPKKLTLVKDIGITKPEDALWIPTASELLTSRAQPNNFLTKKRY